MPPARPAIWRRLRLRPGALATLRPVGDQPLQQTRQGRDVLLRPVRNHLTQDSPANRLQAIQLTPPGFGHLKQTGPLILRIGLNTQLPGIFKCLHMPGDRRRRHPKPLTDLPRPQRPIGSHRTQHRHPSQIKVSHHPPLSRANEPDHNPSQLGRSFRSFHEGTIPLWTDARHRHDVLNYFSFCAARSRTVRAKARKSASDPTGP